jgi:hypothetical protein
MNHLRKTKKHFSRVTHQTQIKEVLRSSKNILIRSQPDKKKELIPQPVLIMQIRLNSLVLKHRKFRYLILINIIVKNQYRKIPKYSMAFKITNKILTYLH